MSDYYLNPGLAQPMGTELDEPYWSGLRENLLRVQQCQACQAKNEFFSKHLKLHQFRQ